MRASALRWRSPRAQKREIRRPSKRSGNMRFRVAKKRWRSFVPSSQGKSENDRNKIGEKQKMALRNKSEVFALIKHDGGIVTRRNIVAVEKVAGGEGKYILKFQADRFIRSETHRITVTIIGGDRCIAQLLELVGGNQIEVHIYQGNDCKDSSF